MSEQDGEDYRRYVHVNPPHARTIVGRIERSLEAHGAFGGAEDGGAALRAECLGLADEGGALALSCGERADSPLR